MVTLSAGTVTLRPETAEATTVSSPATTGAQPSPRGTRKMSGSMSRSWLAVMRTTRAAEVYPPGPPGAEGSTSRTSDSVARPPKRKRPSASVTAVSAAVSSRTGIPASGVTIPVAWSAASSTRPLRAVSPAEAGMTTMSKLASSVSTPSVTVTVTG